MDWINQDIEPNDEMQCPIHGDEMVGHCWPCHVAGVAADPASCEESDE